MSLGIRSRVTVPLQFADGYRTTAEVITFDGLADGKEHLALALGDAFGAEVPLVRPHSECLTGDVLGSERCDCGPQLREAVERITDAGGFLIYLRQEGRGIGLYAKLDAYLLQDAGLDTFEANRRLRFADDHRDYAPAAAMLKAVGVHRIRLLTNNPDKVEQLRANDIDVDEVVPTGVFANAVNARYLESKVARAQHTLRLDISELPATAR